MPKHFVYVLLSLKDHKLYTGYTSDLENRLVKHNRGAVHSTKSRRPLELVCYEIFDSKTEALKRERFLKSLEGSVIKKEIVGKLK